MHEPGRQSVHLCMPRQLIVAGHIGLQKTNKQTKDRAARDLRTIMRVMTAFDLGGLAWQTDCFLEIECRSCDPGCPSSLADAYRPGHNGRDGGEIG